MIEPKTRMNFEKFNIEDKSDILKFDFNMLMLGLVRQGEGFKQCQTLSSTNIGASGYSYSKSLDHF